MKPLSDWPLQARRAIIGVFTDIDDTLTTGGSITADALAALGDLKAAGLPVIPITGRPVRWSERVALGQTTESPQSPNFDITRDIKILPVDAILAENGAVALIFDRKGTQLTQNIDSLLLKIYQQDAATRSRNQARMQLAARRVLREVSDAVLSKDSDGRETDIAIDHSEFTYLSPDKIAQVVQIMQSEGMTATVSSIHINAWFGAHNKWEGARWILRELFGRNLEAEIGQWVYVGDSTNDQLMFEHFPNSIGVANIRRFEAALTHQPTYITQGERGAGFAEVAQAILASKPRLMTCPTHQ